MMRRLFTPFLFLLSSLFSYDYETVVNGHAARAFYSKKLNIKLNSPKIRGSLAGDNFKFGYVRNLGENWLAFDYIIRGAPLIIYNKEKLAFSEENIRQTFLTAPLPFLSMENILQRPTDVLEMFLFLSRKII